MKTKTIIHWLWRAFLTWTLVGFFVLPLDVGASQIHRWISYAPMRELALAILTASDAVWMVLAAAFIYFYLVEQEGLRIARRAAVVILSGAAIIECIGVKTGFPFGPYIYTDRMGARILGVPFSIPLAWLVIVCAARYSVLTLASHAKRWQIAVGTGLLAVATDVSLEWVAWRIRAYWLWYFPEANTPAWPPWQNYLSWFFFATLFAWLAFPAARPAGRHWKPVLMLILINLLFWITILLRLRG